MGLKVIFQIPLLHLISANLGLRRLVLSANISDSAGSQIRRMNKNSVFGGRLFFKCYLKMRKCHAFAQRG